jgi:hypothetical protein
MPMRSVFLGKVRLIACGEILTIDEIQKLVNKKIKSVRGYCPVLEELICSSFSYKLEFLKNGAYLQFFLIEIHQTHFDMDMVGEQGVSNSRDPFRSELTIVLEALERTRGNVTLVASPGIAEMDLLVSTTGSRALRAVRASISKDKARNIELPGLGSPTEIVVPKVPKLLSEGVPMRISAVIDDLLRTKVSLTNIRVIDVKGKEFVNPEFPHSITMNRNVDGPHVKHRSVFMEAWEHKLRLKMDVIVLKKWSDGSIAEFSLVKVLPIRRSRPSQNKFAQNVQDTQHE